LICLIAAFAILGCRRRSPFAHEDHEKRCATGDHAACARACEAGVHGKGGCMEAVHEKNPLRRTSMLTRACDAGEKGACALAAEASITLGLSNPRQYQSLLARGCQAKDERACEKLGDFELLDSFESAKAAYEQACRLQAKNASACSAEIRQRITSFERTQAACTADDLDACEHLLGLAAGRNHDLAYTSALAICKLRGLTEHYRKTELPFSYKLRKPRAGYEGCGLFLLARAASDPNGSFEFQRTKVPEATLTNHHGQVLLGELRLHFQSPPSAQPEQLTLFKTALQTQIGKRLELARRCYDLHLALHPNTEGSIEASFIVDKRGEPLELQSSSELTDLELRACIVSAAIPERFSGVSADLGSIARVEARLELFSKGSSARERQRASSQR